jgi:DNA polymerase III epsilon subunit-like protein
VSVDPVEEKSLSQMQDQENSKHVGCERGIEQELAQHLGLHVVTNEEHGDELKRHKKNDTGQVQFRNDCIPEVRTATAKHTNTASGSIRPEMLDRVKSHDGGHYAIS